MNVPSRYLKQKKREKMIVRSNCDPTDSSSTLLILCPTFLQFQKWQMSEEKDSSSDDLEAEEEEAVEEEDELKEEEEDLVKEEEEGLEQDEKEEVEELEAEELSEEKEDKSEDLTEEEDDDEHDVEEENEENDEQKRRREQQWLTNSINNRNINNRINNSELVIRSEEQFEEERKRERAALLERLRRVREPHLRRKMVLAEPCIPWEYGSNRHDSQKGTGGFGRIRDATTKVHTSKGLTNGDPNAPVPLLSRAGLSSQAGHTPFGSHREQVTRMLEHEGQAKKRCQELLPDPGQTECLLALWARPNPEAKNDHQKQRSSAGWLYGSKRQCVPEGSVHGGGRPWSREELAQSRAALPRLWRVDDTAAARDGREAVRGRSTGMVGQRQVTTRVNGLDRTVEDQLESNRCQSWLGGQMLLQTQSRTGGFQKPRDVVNTSYYARLMSEAGLLGDDGMRRGKNQTKMTADNAIEEVEEMPTDDQRPRIVVGLEEEEK